MKKIKSTLPAIFLAITFLSFSVSMKALAACDCTNTAVTGIPQSECEALVDLYNSTNGPSWTTNTNWNTTSAISSWYSVFVYEGQVRMLMLSTNNLSGVLPASVGDLPELRVLNLQSNDLSGPIPSEIGNLTKLTQLILNQNAFSGQMPSSLGNLAQLEKIYLNTNELEGTVPDEIGNLTQLDELWLSYNRLSGNLPESLSNLTKLISFNISYNHFSGNIPEGIGNLTLLTLFKVSSNQLSGEMPESFSNLTNISSDEKLDLSYNALSASGETLLTFLNEKDPDWLETQTIPPDNLSAANIENGSITIHWTPIPYTLHGGDYKVSYATSSGGPYTLAGTTADKNASSFTAAGLTFGPTYYFVVNTFTPAHIPQQNDLTSSYSVELIVPTSSLAGDVYGDGDVDLKDAILTLKILADMDTSADPVNKLGDIDGDEIIGMENAVYSLRHTANL